MSNTLKFGAGKWAAKAGSVLAYNDENNNFKPLPFTFTRASTATRVNESGLIESVASGVPRIDFLDNADGHLLLEPSRTNVLLQSNQFNTTWTLSSAIDLTSGKVGIGGSVDAWLLKKTDAASRYINQSITLSSSTYSYSVFAKKESGNWLYVRLADSGGSLASSSYFDLENGVVGNTSADSLSIQNYGNGWYRCEVKFTHSIGNVRMYPAVSDGTISGGGGLEGIYIFGAQLEEGSYPTSYIPTSGSSVTRAIDDIELTFPSTSSFSSNSGFTSVVEFGVGGRGGALSSVFLQINDADGYMGYGSSGLNWRCRLQIGATAYLNTATNASRNSVAKLGISCDSNGWSQCANGEVYTSGTDDASSLNVLSTISFITNETFGQIKIRSLSVYNTRLSDSELESLTSL